MSMETRAIIVSQTLRVSAYHGRLAMEVLTCVNNLQRRCDMLEDASAILGSAACCLGMRNTSDGLLLNNHLQQSYSDTSMVANAVDEKPFIGSLHDSSVNNNPSFIHQSNVLDGQVASDVYTKRLRKRPAGFSEEEIAKKKGKANHLESLLYTSADTFLTPGTSAHRHVDKEKVKKAKPRNGKDKVEHGNHLSKSPEPTIGDESDTKMAALEWDQCVSLLKSYGVIGNPDLAVRETLNGCMPHPGYVGDGLLAKICKVCGMTEDANNTVICDGCQDVFHLFCCTRLTSKYFKQKDNWFCASCRKQTKQIGPKFSGKGSNQDEEIFKCTKHESKVRLGTAHQADVPEWQEKALNDDAERCVEGCIGMEISLTEEQKNAERGHLPRSFNAKLDSLCWLPADKIPSGTSQNWVKCNNVIVRGYKTSDGRKQHEKICGKWRRAPLNVEQTDDWECFCGIEWDPLHADCAIPQECPDQEVFIRIADRLEINKDRQILEASGRKSTLRHGKRVV